MIHTNDGASAKPSKANPVKKPLTITTGPMPHRLRTAPLAKLDRLEHAVRISVISPAAGNGWPNVVRIAGQATPSTLSGRPRLMKAM